MNKEKYIELFEYLSYLFCFLMPIFLYIPIYCVPLLLQLLGFIKIALISFIILILLSVFILIYATVQFFIATYNLDAKLRNRCVAIWITIGSLTVISTIIANLINIL